ncbi:MAG: hypothetical protein SOZ52_08515 [Pyramidobacter sp.]|nr:hypothetical protein [Pyramidobacter sp.]
MVEIDILALDDDELNDVYEDMSPDKRVQFRAYMDALRAEDYETRMADLAGELYGEE